MSLESLVPIGGVLVGAGLESLVFCRRAADARSPWWRTLCRVLVVLAAAALLLAPGTETTVFARGASGVLAGILLAATVALVRPPARSGRRRSDT